MILFLLYAWVIPSIIALIIVFPFDWFNAPKGNRVISVGTVVEGVLMSACPILNFFVIGISVYVILQKIPFARFYGITLFSDKKKVSE